MRIRIVAVAALLLTAGSWGLAAANPPGGIPEIDNANARLTVNGNLSVVGCTGEDGISYRTYRGSWKGPETETTPGVTDYNLSGNVYISGIDWTINQTTQRGLLTGGIRLVDSTGAVSYKGKITLVTQQIAGTTGAQARGFVVADTYIAGVPDKGSLIANVEMKIASPTSASGLFGDAPGSFGFANYSVTTINRSC